MSKGDQQEWEFETKPFMAHLEDLRWTIIRSAVALVSGMIIAAVSVKYLLTVLFLPLIWAGKDPKDFLVNMGVIDPFSIHLEISVFGGLLLSLPFILYFVSDFLLPALTPQEKKYILPTFSAGVVLFGIGVVFCYFLVLRAAILFFLRYSDFMDQRAMWRSKDLIDFEVQMLLAFGLAFEMPLIILILNFLGIVSSQMLASKRRHAAFGFFVLACCIIPSTDIFSLSIMAVPLYVLYEMCIWISYFTESRQKKKQLATV